MAIEKPIRIDQKSDIVWPFLIEVLTDPTQPYDETLNPFIPLNLTTYTAQFEAYWDYTSSPAVISYTSADYITLDNLGNLQIVFLASQTSAIPLTEECTELVYNLEIQNVSTTKRVAQGRLIINKNLIV